MSSDEIFEPVITDEIATYTLGTAVADPGAATAVIEVFRHKNDERVCVSAVIMLEGMVACPAVEEIVYEGETEQQRFLDAMTEALGRMAEFYDSLPEDQRKELEGKKKE